MELLATYRYDLGLLKPILARGVRFETRSGFIFKFRRPDGQEAFGEFAPLEEATKTTQGTIKTEGTRIALEMAQFEGPRVGQVPLAYLIDEGAPEGIRVAMRAVAQGYNTLKVKVGRQTLQEDLLLVKEIRKAVGKAVRIRLDANRAWDLYEAVEFGKAVGRFDIEFLEEPVKNVADLGDFIEKTQIRVGLDETLASCHSGLDPESRAGGSLGREQVVPKACGGLDSSFRSQARCWNDTVLVLKPGLLGINRCLEFAHLARQTGAECVVSSFYESGLALQAFARLHALIGSTLAAGLSTFSVFSNDTLAPPFRAFRGSCHLDQHRQIAYDNLSLL